VIRLLHRSLPEPPKGLEEAIKERVRAELGGASEGKPSGMLPFRTRRPWVPAWGLSAAALVALALGTGIIWSQKDGEEDPLQVAVQEPLPEAWLWDDGMIAGAPDFDGLSDEELEALLEELER
jgi:hypothetical protein